jgi:crossover junction endodeoxyribonuclease RusA
MKWLPIVTLKLPYPVSANAYWRTRIIYPKNGPMAGRAMPSVYVTKEAEQFKESVGWLLRNAGVRDTIKGRVRIDIQLRPPCPQDWKKRQRDDPLWWADSVRRLDLDNCRKVVYDSLKGIAIGDDVQVWKDTGEVLEPVEGTDAHVVVRISRAVAEHPQGALEL